MSITVTESTLLEDWLEFERNILPTDFGVEQRRKAKFAFYSGTQRIVERILKAQPTHEDTLAIVLRQIQIDAQELANSIAEDFHK